MVEEPRINVEVVYALPYAQTVIAIQVPAGTTVVEAIMRSGIQEKHPELDVATVMTGVYGRRVGLTATLSDHDRIEIYRPLIADPKQARRGRARKLNKGSE